MVTDKQAADLAAEIQALRFVAATLCGMLHGSGIADITRQAEHFRQAHLHPSALAALQCFADEVTTGVARRQSASETMMRGGLRVIDGGPTDRR